MRAGKNSKLEIRNSKQIQMTKKHPHLFPPPRRAGEDEGGGKLVLNFGFDSVASWRDDEL